MKSEEQIGGINSGLEISTAWVGLFKGNLNAKGRKLGFVAPLLNNGKKLAQLEENEESLGAENWKHTIIFYAIGVTPTFTAVQRYFSSNWNNIAKPDIFLHDDGYFVVRLQSRDDFDNIVYTGPHMFYGKPTVIKPWTSDFNFNKEVLRVVPIWVKFPNLPLNWWSDNSLSRIASVLGVPICADECTSRQLRVSFARVLVEIDVTKPLVKNISIRDAKGDTIEQVVRYEWVPHFCKKCNKVGHNCELQKPINQHQQAAQLAQKKVQQVWVKKPTVVPETEHGQQQEQHTQLTGQQEDLGQQRVPVQGAIKGCLSGQIQHDSRCLDKGKRAQTTTQLQSDDGSPGTCSNRKGQQGEADPEEVLGRLGDNQKAGSSTREPSTPKNANPQTLSSSSNMGDEDEGVWQVVTKRGSASKTKQTTPQVSQIVEIPREEDVLEPSPPI